MDAPDIRKLLVLLATGDPAAAQEVRTLGHRLLALADSLDAKSAPENPFVAEGGMSDRVQISVVGPDGVVKQATDTNPAGN